MSGCRVARRVHQLGLGEDHLGDGVELGQDVADGGGEQVGAAIDAHIDGISGLHAADPAFAELRRFLHRLAERRGRVRSVSRRGAYHGIVEYDVTEERSAT